jgi:DNA-binding transcriptional MocR family regulator
VGDLLGASAAAGHPDRVFVFGSTSKVTLAGAGVSFLGSSPANMAWFQSHNAMRTIGPDKLNQLRHVRFLRDAQGVQAHMAAHRRLLAPKFDAVQRILTTDLGGTGLASWSRPQGGYFVTLVVPSGCAREVVRRAGEAGIALTPAGSTHPYGDDPDDRVIRLAPTFPSEEELAVAMHGVTTCVRLVGFAQAQAQA